MTPPIWVVYFVYVMDDPVLERLEAAAAQEREQRQRRDKLVVEATQQGHSRRRVAEAAGFRSPNAVQRILRAAGLAALVVLGLAGQASAATITPESGSSYPYQRWLDEAMVPTPDAEITVHETPCPSEAPWGGTAPCAQGTEIWLPPTRHPHRLFFHEVGHVFDTVELDDDERAAFLALIDEVGSPWMVGPDAPGEQFAEAYQWCARFEALPRARDRRGTWSFNYGYWPGPRLHLRVCALIRSSG